MSDRLLPYTDETQEVEGEIDSISQTLGAAILEHMFIGKYNASLECEWPSNSIGQLSHMKYDRQLKIPSSVQDIKVLQLKLDATKDKCEQRALEEDVTGKILWLFFVWDLHGSK